MNTELKSIARALDGLVAAQHKGTWDYIHIIVILLTLCVVTWYTIETYRLRKAGQDQTAETAKLFQEAQRQNEVSVMPILAVAIEPLPDRDSPRIVLLNVGSGPAFNLSIDRLDWGSRQLEIEHESSVLRPGQGDDLLFHLLERNSGNLLDASTLCSWIHAHRLPDPLKIVIRCYSVNSIAYAFMFECTSHAKKLRITYRGATSLNGDQRRGGSDAAPWSGGFVTCNGPSEDPKRV